MNASQLINQASGIVEYYTPPEIIEAARECLGEIDLDPASSHAANAMVKAGTIYTVENDGLSQLWFGRVWLNHPFGRTTNGPWINKLVAEWSAMNVEQACCITFAATSEQWFQPLLQQPQCYLCPRTNYLLPDGTIYKGVTKGSVITYFGQDVARFARAFDKFGTIKTTYV